MKLRKLCALAVLAAALVAPATGQDESRPPGPGPTPEERWAQMTPEERAVLRARYDEYMQLSDEHRRELRKRFERVRVLQEAARTQLPTEVRLQLEALQGAERRALLQEYYESEFAERGRRVRELLPPHWRERLERAQEDEHSRLVAALNSERRLRGPERMLDELSGGLNIPPEERERLCKLPPEQRFNELVLLRRKSLEARIQENGLPEWMTQEQWDQLRVLPPRQFLEKLHALEGGGRGGPGRGGPHHRLLRPDPKWLVELSGLEPDARRRAIDQRLLERVAEHLKSQPEMLPEPELTRLRTLEGKELGDALRSLLQRSRCEKEHPREDPRHPQGGPGVQPRPAGQGAGGPDGAPHPGPPKGRAPKTGPPAGGPPPSGSPSGSPTGGPPPGGQRGS